jgi:hypothetical protein
MKTFKFFSNNEPILEYDAFGGPFQIQPRTWIGSSAGVPKWINGPTGMIYYMEFVGVVVDPVNDNQMPEISSQLQSKMITVATYGPHNYQEFLDAHRNHHIWIYSVNTETSVYNEHNINDLPIGEPVMIRAHIETE